MSTRKTRETKTLRPTLKAAVAKFGASQPDLQIKFLKELMKKPQEAEKFLHNPWSYAKKHKVVLEPDIIELVVDAVLFDPSLDRRNLSALSPAVRKELEKLVSPGTIAAWPAAVAAGAAVVAAAAAVVSAVCSCTSDASLLNAFKRVGSRDVILPGRR